MASVREIVSKSTELVSLPDVYFIVKSLLEDPTASLVDVADVLSTDPALTARCLKLVNSAMYGLSVRVETVSRAVSLLGAAQTHDMVLASSVTGAFARLATCKTFDMQHFWETSLRRAVTAQCLAKHCDVLDTERLFVAGLLSDVGHLILFSQEPALASQANHHATESDQPLADIERTVIGCDYTQVGSALLREWKLPPLLIETTEHQLDPASATDYQLEVAIVHIAAVLGDAGETLARDWHDAVQASAWQTTRLAPTIADTIAPEISERLAETAGLLTPVKRRTA